MTSHFFSRHGGRRLRHYPPQPALADDAPGDSSGALLDFEVPLDRWAAVPVPAEGLPDGAAPRRFVDGCHAGQTVAWLSDPDGHPVPVLLAEIGGVCLRRVGRLLAREFAAVERVAALVADPFPLADVESLAAQLAGAGFRLLPAAPPEDDAGRRRPTFDFEAMRNQTRNRVNYEMEALEELAACQDRDSPTLIDGRLGRFHDPGLARRPIVGVIKQQRESYLHPLGWRVLLGLEPGQRTPAFAVESKELAVLSWYLKLEGARGALPNWGVVRVEVPLQRFHDQGGDFDAVGRLSRTVLGMRCRRSSYARGPVSLDPIVRAEESLKALMTPPSALAQRFYRLAGV